MLRDLIPVVCFVTENYVIYHLFCNIIRKRLRVLDLGHPGKGGVFDMDVGEKSWQQLVVKLYRVSQ